MYAKYLKRIIDVALCLACLPVFLLLYLVIGLVIKVSDGGPVFYTAGRIGKNSRVFGMYKFRSMQVGAPNLLNADGSTYNAKDDPRVTRIGKFLRDTSLDETPQILNVLKGDMSIIGPRASLSAALNTYRPDELDKMKVRPGITGYTQAYYRNNLPVRDKRLKDAWYANNVTLLLDLKILIKTILTVLRREGLYTNSTDYRL